MYFEVVEIMRHGIGVKMYLLDNAFIIKKNVNCAYQGHSEME